MEANQHAGIAALTGGLVGVFGAALGDLFGVPGAGDTLEGYSSGVGIMAFGDAVAGTKADAVNMSNMTAAQPYRPDIVPAPGEHLVAVPPKHSA